jgi:hypothetical protein
MRNDRIVLVRRFRQATMKTGAPNTTVTPLTMRKVKRIRSKTPLSLADL